jgi:hypothetical protein
MNRPKRKTIEFGEKDLYLRFMFKETSGTQHWSMHEVSTVNNHKAPPVGICTHPAHAKHFNVVWTDEEL